MQGDVKMGVRNGLNNIYLHGIYVNDAQNALYEYKIFHTTIEEPDQILITNLRNGKTYGPLILPNQELEFEPDLKKFLDNFAEKHYPNT